MDKERKTDGHGMIEEGALASMTMTAHRTLHARVEELASLTLPERIEWCDGPPE